MADVAPAVPAAGNAQQQPQGGAIQGAFRNIFGTVARMALMWYVMAWFKGSSKAPPPLGSPAAIAQTVTPRFGKGELFDVYCFVTERPVVHWQYIAASPDMRELVWSVKGIPLGEDPTHSTSILYRPSEAVQQRNASLYLQAVFVRAGGSIDPQDPEFLEEDVHVATHNLIRYMPRPKKAVGHNLLSSAGNGTQARSLLPTWMREQLVKANIMTGEGEEGSGGGATQVSTTVEGEEAEEADEKELVSWFKPNVTVAMVDFFTPFNLNAIPPQVAPYLKYRTVDPEGRKQYDPVIHFDEFWLLREKHIQMNASVTEVMLHLKLQRMGATWFHLLQQMDKSFEMQVDMGMSKEGESEELKRVLLEGNPILLAVTFAVSLLHTVFDMLAFKNDIGFWKNNKSMEGLSARSVIINAFCQLVILLYLMDNETSYVVLFSSFLGTAIEFWKVTKAMKVEVLPSFPYLKVSDRATYNDSSTKQYDKEAMTYLSWVMYPLLVGYCVYTLVYQSHKSWYSWMVSSCVGAVYLFGFILMCPQLYLNYKLKSVAHLPWRQMTYKFLNTIIDDLFAFVIKMPTLHRLSVFRDDLVFLVYIYQRWIYRVDKTRVNEFGFSGEPAQEEPGQAPAVTEGPSSSGAATAVTAAATADKEGPVSSGATATAATAAAATETKLVDGTADKRGEADVKPAGKSNAKKHK